LLDWLAAAYFLIINQDLQKATLFLLFAVIMRLEELSDEIKGEK
jgi:formate hydrogenlyase subunit 3/multisubunit Na+/H+ antiporter MnhD subunit